MKKSIFFLILNCISFLSYSAEIVSSSIEYSATSKTSNTQSIAKMWGLKESDIEKYNLIMQGPRGTFSPNIAPPLALALEEDDLAEKRRYITVYAKLEHDRTKKDLAVSRMYRDIFNELYREPLINDNILFQGNEDYIRKDDRFVIFVDANCEDCKGSLLVGLMRTANFPDNPTDIFVKGLQQENDLHKWAANNSIKVEDVQSGSVTLNLIQKETVSAMKNQSYQIYILRDNSLFNFTN